MGEKNRRLLERLTRGRRIEVRQQRPLTRGGQTAWIIGAMAVLYLLYTGHERTNLPKWDYARCEGVFGTDQSCRAAVAAYRLSGGRTDMFDN